MSQSGASVRRPPPPPPPRVPPPGRPVPAPSGGRPLRTVLARLAIALAVAAALLTGLSLLDRRHSSSPQPSTPSHPRAPASLPSARLVGNFNIAEKVTWQTGYESLKVGSRDVSTWRLVPACSKGACAVRLRFTVSNVLSRDRVITLRLRRSGRVYQGSGRASLSTCQFEPMPGTMKVTLRVLAGAWIDNRWIATRVRGSLGYTTPESRSGLYTCSASGYTATLTGTRRA